MCNNRGEIDIIQGTKCFIEQQVHRPRTYGNEMYFDGIQKVYPFTNEDIVAVLKLIDISEKERILSVMGSGDQVLNFIINSAVKDIDTFDTNILTEYYVLGFKRAMILKYGYDDFCAIMRKLDFEYKVSTNYINDLILGLLPFMDKKYAIFWKEIADYYYNLTKDKKRWISLFKMLTLDSPTANIVAYNNYLNDCVRYEELRSRLGAVNINFKCANASNLLENFFGNKYDVIYLSNILDYFDSIWGRGWNYSKLQEYKKSIENIMLPGGIIFLQYIFFYEILRRKRKCIIDGSLIKESDLTNGEEFCVLRHSSFKMVEELCGNSFCPIDRRDTSDGLILCRHR